jgi:hypothetical protein
MNRTGTILAAIFLITACFISQPSGAQAKTKQKKEFSKQKKDQDEMMKSMDMQKKSLDDAMKEYHGQFDTASWNDDNLPRKFGRRFAMPYINEAPFFDMNVEPFIGHPFGEDGERTTWDFSKSVKESSFSSDYTFDVEPTANTVVMAVNGDCKKGDIRIKIIMPGGKVYSDILIDEFGNLNWRKSFTISEEENKDKAGAWKFQINASKATGYFKISLQTY